MSNDQLKPIEPQTFEQNYELIVKCINKRKHYWRLTSIGGSMDFDDVKQILLRHIYLKWHLYNQSRKLEPWVFTVINSQMINLIRNHYGNFSKPCLKCKFYEGNDLCSKFGTISTQCDLYKSWVNGKKRAHDIKLPLPMENHENEVFDIKSNQIDVSRTAINIHERMKHILKPLEYKVYKLLFIDHKSESEVGKILEFKTRENGRKAGYKQLANIRKNIINKVKECLKNDEIDIV